MNDIRTSLVERKDQQFYGYIARQELQKCSDDGAVRRFKCDADNFFEVATKYVEKWYDFNDRKYQILDGLRLKTVPAFENLLEIVDSYKISIINHDLLFEEFLHLKKFMTDSSEEVLKLSCDGIWTKFFDLFDCPNILKIVEYVFSIPHSNAASERIFSLMTTAWRKERNRLLLSNLEAELMVKQNFNMSCTEFQQFLKNKGSNILKNIKSNQKYM